MVEALHQGQASSERDKDRWGFARGVGYEEG